MRRLLSRYKYLLMAGIALCIILLMTGLYSCRVSFQEQPIQENTVDDSYNSIFLSMYPVDGFCEEDFEYYRGFHTYVDYEPINSVEELSHKAQAFLKHRAKSDAVYLGLNPGGKLWDKESKSLKKLFEAYPDVTFEILLPMRPMSDWVLLDEKEISDAVTAYYDTVLLADSYDNVLCFFTGGFEWLVKNPLNYNGKKALKPLIAKKILCLTFCDREDLISKDNAPEVLRDLYNMILEEKNHPETYPDLSQKCIVFFGDSILGLDYGSYSVPMVIHSLAGASVYNYAIGGTTACDWKKDSSTDNSFRDRLEAFLSETQMVTGDGTCFPFSDYVTDSEDLVFVICYGYNDYLRSLSLEEYRNALSRGISELKEKYPMAQLVMMTPFRCPYFLGTERNDDSLTPEDYAEQVRELAADNKCTLFDLSEIFSGMLSEKNYKYFFRDHCHYNEQGRFFLGKQLIHTIQLSEKSAQ